MRFLFASAPLPGHLDWGGYLATATALKKRDHEVLWASGQAVSGLVNQAGLPFHALAETGWRWPPPPPLAPSPDMDAETLRRVRAQRALDQWLETPRVTQATEALIAVAHNFKPDVIVSEAFVSAAGLAAEALKTPFVVAGWPAMQPKAAGPDPLVDEARSRLQILCTRFGLQGRNWTQDGPPSLQSPYLHVTYWSPRWYSGVSLAPQTRHAGGRAQVATLPPAWPTLDPWVFITLGTSFGRDANFFLAAAQAAHALGCLPILALGGQFSAAERAILVEKLPPTAIVEETIEFNAVFPHLSAALHHGGAGVTHALVTHAAPQIIVPHAADQMHQAQGVVRSSVGLHIPAKEATIARLTRGLAEVLPDLSPMRTNAADLAAEFAELGGPEAAATMLEDVPAKNKG
jgi:UDP:flavonoid glycosyltransferase YjiC (YdhE family)